MWNDKPWFKSHVFPFWLIPISWEGWLLQLLGVPLTFVPAYLCVAVFEVGGLPFLVATATFVCLAGLILLLALWHTQKN